MHCDIYDFEKLVEIFAAYARLLALLQKQFFSTNRTPFWVREKKQSNAEIDFVFESKGRLYPVEVKSGKEGTLRSLHQLICHSNINLAIRFFDHQYSLLDAVTPSSTNMPVKKYRLLSLPFYCAGKIGDYLDLVNSTH